MRISVAAGFTPLWWADEGGYKTGPYADDTKALIHALAPSEIVTPFFWLLTIGGKTCFLLVFVAPEFLSP